MDRTVKLLFASAIALLCLYGVALAALRTRGPALMEDALLLTGSFALAGIAAALRRSVAAIRKERQAPQPGRR